MIKWIIGIVLALVIIPVLVCVSSYVTYHNYGNAQEQSIKAAYKNNQNILSQYNLKLGEVVQVPSMYKDDLKEVFDAALQGRYGENGSKAVFQFIKEQNPTIDSSMYVKIQQLIESGRNEFQLAQTQLLDKKRSYETALGNVWSGLWLRITGYPKIDLDEYDIVVEESTVKTFETKRDTVRKLR